MAAGLKCLRLRDESEEMRLRATARPAVSQTRRRCHSKIGLFRYAPNRDTTYVQQARAGIVP
jgi:hypothetical protein